jgi:hypothetical protein
VPAREVSDKAVEIEVVLSLFASDTVCLATVVTKHTTLIAADKHLLNRDVAEYAQRKEARVINLKEKIW